MESINKSMLRRSEINSVNMYDIEVDFKIYISTKEGAFIAAYKSRDLTIDSFNSIEAQINKESEFITIENYIL